MNHSERLAQALIEKIIHGSSMIFKEDQHSGEYDFDLLFKDDSVGVVEVTEATNEDMKETHASILNKKKGGSRVSVVSCQNSWVVIPLPEANINKIRNEVDEYLSAIESEGFSKFFPNDIMSSKAVCHIVHDLKIEMGMVMVRKLKTKNCIFISLPVNGGVVTNEHIQEAVKAEINKKDNLQKLNKSKAQERHLFIYISEQNYLPWKELVDMTDPPKSPTIPKEITTIWVVTNARTLNKFTVWKINRINGWENIGILEID